MNRIFKRVWSIFYIVSLLVSYLHISSVLASSVTPLGKVKTISVEGTVSGTEYRGTVEITVQSAIRVPVEEYKNNLLTVDSIYDGNSEQLENYDCYLVNIKCAFKHMEITRPKKARKCDVIKLLHFYGTTRDINGKVTSNMVDLKFDESLESNFISKYSGASDMKKGKEYKLSATGDILVVVPKGVNEAQIQLIAQKGLGSIDNEEYWFALQ